MRLEIPFSEAQKRYPELIKEVMALLRSGRSKEKNRNPEELTWAFEWTAKAKPFRSSKPEKTLENALNNISGIQLNGRIGRWSVCSESVITKIPNEIIKEYEETYLPQPLPLHLRSLPKLKIENGKEMNEHPILMGYRDKKGDVVNLLAFSRGVEIVYRIEEDYALWSGGLRKAFDAKLKNASGGDVFAYNKKSFVKLTDADILDLSKKTYEIGIAF